MWLIAIFSHFAFGFKFCYAAQQRRYAENFQMTTTDTDIETQTLRLEENIAKLDELNHRLIAVLKTKKTK